jgi:hypothetical protein
MSAAPSPRQGNSSSVANVNGDGNEAVKWDRSTRVNSSPSVTSLPRDSSNNTIRDSSIKSTRGMTMSRGSSGLGRQSSRGSTRNSNRNTQSNDNLVISNEPVQLEGSPNNGMFGNFMPMSTPAYSSNMNKNFDDLNYNIDHMGVPMSSPTGGRHGARGNTNRRSPRRVNTNNLEENGIVDGTVPRNFEEDEAILNDFDRQNIELLIKLKEGDFKEPKVLRQIKRKDPLPW